MNIKNKFNYVSMKNALALRHNFKMMRFTPNLLKYCADIFHNIKLFS